MLAVPPSDASACHPPQRTCLWKRPGHEPRSLLRTGGTKCMDLDDILASVLIGAPLAGIAYIAFMSGGQ